MNSITKKLAAFFIIIVLITMSFPAYAEDQELPVLEKPVSFIVRLDENGDFQLRLTQPDSIMKLINSDISIICEFDWKINDGPWKFDSKWDDFYEQPLIDYYEAEYEWFNVTFFLNNISHDERNSIDIPVFPSNLQVDKFDLQNNTYSFRYRFVYEYNYHDSAADTWGYKFVTSPWSDVTSIGKNAGGQIPDGLAAPENLKGELKQHEDGRPYFRFTCDIPKSVEEANKLTNVWNELDWKIGNGKWASESNEVLISKGHLELVDNLEVDPVDEGGWNEINIKENTYYFRMRFQFQKPDGSFVYSPFSNIVEIGTPAFYEKASTWAEAELQAAYANDLIPDILIGADMTQPITREEFAELTVRLCEKTIENNIMPASPNPFTDTANPQILKAYNLGITTGTSKTTFSPRELINREQCATMLFRAIKAIAPNADYNISGVKDFPDQKDISSWAVEGTKYMFKLGIIKGDSNGNFMPKAVTPSQEAVKYGMATREAAILMTVRTFDKLPEIKTNTSAPIVTPTPSPIVTPTPVAQLPTVTPTPVAPSVTVTPTPAAPSSSVAMEIDALAEKANKINSIYYEWASFADGEKLQEGKAWMKGSMAKRQEPMSTGGTMIFIYDMSKGEYLTYVEGEKTAYQGDYDVNNPEILTKPTDFISWYFPEDLNTSGSETVKGQICTVLVAKEEGMETGKVWVSNETGLKLREEYILGPDTPKVTVEFNYIVIDGPIDDAVFELPAGITIE